MSIPCPLATPFRLMLYCPSPTGVPHVHIPDTFVKERPLGGLDTVPSGDVTVIAAVFTPNVVVAALRGLV